MALPASGLAAEAPPAEWVRRGAAGDRHALGLFVRRYQDRVYCLLWRLSGDRELALDLSQETFCRAFGSLGSFRPGADPSPWLAKIASNLYRDHLRRRRPESLEAWRDEGRDLEPAAEDVRISRWAEGEDVRAALGKLPEPWRQALVLRYYGDLSYEEISEALEVPLGTAKTWLFRGREQLRVWLAGSDDGGAPGLPPEAGKRGENDG